MLLASLATALIFAGSKASTEEIYSRQASNITFTVTNFTAFMADPYIEGAQSNLSFHVVDSRPEYYKETDCVIPPTYFSLYAITALFEYCGDVSQDIAFMFQDGQVAIRRGYADKSGSYITASGSLNPYWKADGPDANVTVTSTGKLFTRKSEWLFPVNRIQITS